MIAPLDIFKVEGPGRVVWIEAAHELEAARRRVRELIKESPCEYVIFSQKTGHRMSIKPGDLPSND